MFRSFKTSPEIIRLALMMYVRYPLSLRNVEDLLHECGIEITHETVRFGGTILGRFSPLKSDRTEFGRCNHSSIGRLNALKRQLWGRKRNVYSVQARARKLPVRKDHEPDVCIIWNYAADLGGARQARSHLG
jgi:hypothetical protein